MSYLPPNLTAGQLADLQLQQLQWTVHHAYHNNALYRDKLDAAGLTPRDIRTLDDLQRLPLTTKADLHAHYPFAVLSVPEEQVVRVHASSGTTGRRTVAYYTQKDIDDWADMMARCMHFAGLTNRDRVQITPGYGLWTAGVGFQLGVERLGAMAVPAGPMGTDLQIELLETFGSTALCATSSYGLLLGEELQARGMHRSHTLKVGIFGSERWGEGMRQRIEALLGIDTYDIIGMTETYGPGTGLDCHHHQGIHYWADYLIFEIIDPETKAVLPPGQQGEMVVTSLRKEAMPLIRYRTRDLTRILPGTCACGSVLPRIDRILGRTDDGVKLRGVLLYPGDIDRVLSGIAGVSSEYRIVLSRDGGRDHGLLRVEADPAGSRERQALTREVAERIQADLRVSMDVEVVDYSTLERTQRKTQRIIDQRVL